MHVVRTLAALSVATLATACASPGYMNATNATPASASMAPVAMGGAGSKAAMEPRMKAMQEMHQKMAKAAPAERQALMGDHMKAMQGGMDMMKEMHGMQTGSGTGGMGVMGSHGASAPMAGMGDGTGMPPDMATRHQMMTDHIAVMQMMMDMMADRMPPARAAQ